MPSSNHPVGQKLVAAIDCRWRLVLERRPPDLIQRNRAGGHARLVHGDTAGKLLKLRVGAQFVEEGINVQERNPEGAFVNGST